MGTLITDPVRLDMPRPDKTENGWRAHVTIIDVFGNLTTDLPADVLEGRRDVLIRVHGQEIDGIIESYGHRDIGGLVAVVDSEDYIEISVVNGNAARTLDASVGDVVEVQYKT
jgi:S-adenosylmethionine hydrolase